ncbi:peptide ABC transporter permease [Listeria sp. FSL L7-1699]|uniref:Peptide ABC transporter permease n=1 Tax=Listeria farberi TaxID=2713500 RepID=A0ABR6SQU1_9LIST|nr:peptide ABC transporter permease [Listeria farberi]MBC1376644.1 peptide ABC transporter permease [Listeria farberi]MBC1382409.1 peptide ABC transporter permease [Listeria farberi]MBC2268731.1 peptide ABC transporter permease [Listeria farberi]
MKRLIIVTSVFFGTLLIGSIFTSTKPFDGSDISLIGGFSIFILSYFIAGFLSRKKNS